MKSSKEDGDEYGYSGVDLRVVHAADIAKFRKRMELTLNKYPCYDTDFALLRWLRGCKFDIELAAQRMERALNTMDLIGTFGKDLSTVEKIEENVRKYTPVAEYFPGGNTGYDKNGYVVHIHDIGRANPGSLISCGRVSEFFIASIYDQEGRQCLIRSEEAKRDRKLGVVVIIDFSEFSFDIIFHMPATKIYMSAIIMLQDMFPDTAVKLYLVNASTAVNVLARMVKMILAKETVDLIEILGSDWKEVLVRRHGVECLPRSYGGLRNDDMLRKGGVIPDSLKAQLVKKFVTPDRLSKIAVSARSALTVPINIEMPNLKLSWYFKCSSGDIDFSVIYEGREVWPCFRISTEFSPEYNEIQCKKTGTYELLFSNKHSLLWTKYIYYCVEVTQKAT